MAQANIDSLRRAAVAGIVGATATAISGLVVQAVVQPETDVSDERWSYPWSSARSFPSRSLGAHCTCSSSSACSGSRAAASPAEAVAARVGVTWRSPAPRCSSSASWHRSRSATQHVDDTGATIVGAIFGIAILLTAVGFLAAGVATLRARLWQRLAPLHAARASGIWSLALARPELTQGAPDAGVAVYGLCLLALAVALYTQPVPSSATAPQLRPQEQGT